MEVYLLFNWIADAPLPALAYLAAVTALGFVCVKIAKVGFAEFLRQLAAARRGDINAEGGRILLGLGKMWVVGVLLIFPGYLTDLAAAAVWLLVRRPPHQQDNRRPDTIDVEARIDDD